ncbi:MAG: hypothetical protein K0Q77_1668 [Anaerosporomusa subterranea]|jgi:hypothetical protein|nr:hypothetical protein [Anaerosporomusa subterranea]
MNYFKENLAFLKKYSPALFKTVEKEKPLEETYVELQNEQGSYQLFVQSKHATCSMHSLYDVNREIKHMFTEVEEDTRVLIVFGLGLGYSLNYIMDHYPKVEHIFIIEPDLAIFKTFLKLNDFRGFSRLSAKISFLVNQSASDALSIVTAMLTGQIYRKLGFVYSISYRTLYIDYFNVIHDGLKQLIRNVTVSTTTKNLYRYVWTANQWKNLKQYKVSANEVFSRLKNLPAIIVGAGPSLNKNIHLLKQVKDKAVILAVGSSMTILQKHGITPDLRIAIEGWKSNAELFAQVDTSECPLVCSNNLYYKIQQTYQGALMEIVLTIEYLAQFIYSKAHIPYLMVDSGYSVANITLNFLCKAGFQKVIFMGQDLCYTNNKLHASGSWKEGKKVSKGDIPALDIYGRNVLTDRPFLSMKSQLEETIKNCPDVNFINATEGGLPILGAENIDFEQVIKQDLVKISDVSKTMSSLVNDNLVEEKYHRQIKQIVDEVSNEVMDILALVEDNLNITKEIECLPDEQKYSKYTLDRLEKVRKSLNDLSKIPFYAKVVYPVLFDILEAIETSFSTKNEDLQQRILLVERRNVGQLIEIKQYVEFVKALIEDYKGEREFEVVFES